VKAGSFTAAEVCLNKSKSAISIHISSLEARLGQTLCRRGRSGFSLTPEGEKIYEICKDLFADLDKFRDRVSRATSMYGGTLTIAIDDGLIGQQEVIAEAIGNFKSACPDVFLAVYTSSPERVMQLLLDTSVDVGICAMPRDLQGADAHLLGDGELALYCSDTHPLANTPAEEITEELLGECEFVDLGSYQEPDAEEFTSRMRSMGRSGQASSRLLLILTGKMIGLLPRDFAAEWVAKGRLTEIGMTGPALHQKSYAVVRRDVAASKVCGRMLLDLKRAFANFDRNNAAQAPIVLTAGVEPRSRSRPAITAAPLQIRTGRTVKKVSGVA